MDKGAAGGGDDMPIVSTFRIGFYRDMALFFIRMK
jgi:hypothetical protein